MVKSKIVIIVYLFTTVKSKIVITVYLFTMVKSKIVNSGKG